MIFTTVLLSLAAVGSAKPWTLLNDSGGQSEESSLINDDEKAFRLRSRDLLRQGFKLTVHDVKASTAPTVDKVTQNVVQLYTGSGTGPSQRYIQLLNSAKANIGNGTIKNWIDQVYMTPVTIGGQEFFAAVDTGSSDTWVIQEGYKCTMPQTAGNAAGECGFGKAYKKSPTFASAGNEIFSINYPSESVSGVMGTETITLGNITVKDQKLALVDTARWRGDGTSSGLIGLAFPSNSATWDITGGKNDYSPIFTTMHKQNLVAPYFSLALNRRSEAPGILALGGLPGGNIKYNTTWAKTPMQYLTFSNDDATKKPFGDFDYRLYRTSIESFTIGNQPSVQPSAKDGAVAETQVSIDSGTAAMLLPSDIAESFNAQWEPPATFEGSAGWVVDCTAKAPKFGVKIGGVMLYVDSEDLMTPHEPGMPGTKCGSAVQQAGPPGSGMLGSTFLKSVVAVFDVGGAQLRFAQRIR
ncbi:putative aspartic-type endopeptidase [Venturia nashicola]|nr:putative aspartic-type endopeptidase [Venturia nashicola]